MIPPVVANAVLLLETDDKSTPSTTLGPPAFTPIPATLRILELVTVRMTEPVAAIPLP
jgi:hypothetical protein